MEAEFWTVVRIQLISAGSIRCNFMPRKISDDQSYLWKPSCLKRSKFATTGNPQEVAGAPAANTFLPGHTDLWTLDIWLLSVLLASKPVFLWKLSQHLVLASQQLPIKLSPSSLDDLTLWHWTFTSKDSHHHLPFAIPSSMKVHHGAPKAWRRDLAPFWIHKKSALSKMLFIFYVISPDGQW